MKNDKWFQLADTKEKRFYAACTVFEGKIVVTGGRYTKTVEAYDYYENKWTYLPDMIEERYDHASVSMGNKLFVIGGSNNSTFELFDSFSRKFIFFKTSITGIFQHFTISAVIIGYNIVVFAKVVGKTKIFIYNIKNNQCCDRDVNDLDNLWRISCVKYSLF